jgi:hypothetical protein
VFVDDCFSLLRVERVLGQPFDSIGANLEPSKREGNFVSAQIIYRSVLFLLRVSFF